MVENTLWAALYLESQVEVTGELAVHLGLAPPATDAVRSALDSVDR